MICVVSRCIVYIIIFIYLYVVGNVPILRNMRHPKTVFFSLAEVLKRSGSKVFWRAQNDGTIRNPEHSL